MECLEVTYYAGSVSLDVRVLVGDDVVHEGVGLSGSVPAFLVGDSLDGCEERSCARVVFLVDVVIVVDVSSEHNAIGVLEKMRGSFEKELFSRRLISKEKPC